MRNRIFGGIGVVWGGAVVVFALLRGGPQGEGAYAAGGALPPPGRPGSTGR
jgi:hypothetical protein